MNISGDRVVEAAKGWLGTPYVHQARNRHAGTDCLGLILGVWETVSGPLPGKIPPYTADWSEPSRREILLEAAEKWLNRKPLVDAARGDVLLFRMRATAMAKHLGIVSSLGTTPRFIHSYSGHGVLESPLSDPWRRRIVARFAFPDRSG